MPAESFVQKLSPEDHKYFVSVTKMPFKEQAKILLNAYWNELKDQAEFIYSVIYKKMIETDMHAKNIDLIHKYEEGNDLEINMAFYFYEKLCKFVEENEEFSSEKYKISQPRVLTAIARKKEIREKVDFTFSQRISLLEALLDQYRDTSNINPAEFVNRSIHMTEHPKILEARLALEEVNRNIQKYETKKFELEEKSKLPGIKGNKAKHELAIYEQGPEREQLNVSLLHAEALLRQMRKKFGCGSGSSSANGDEMGGSTMGTLFWMERELREKKERYGNRK